MYTPRVRSGATRLLALALLWMIFPGALEATENIAHALRSGHLAHAAEAGDSHSDPGPEHGCNGTFHLCSCHPAPVGLLATASPLLAVADEDSFFIDRAPDDVSGHQHSIEHPPRS